MRLGRSNHTESPQSQDFIVTIMVVSVVTGQYSQGTTFAVFELWGGGASRSRRMLLYARYAR